MWNEERRRRLQLVRRGIEILSVKCGCFVLREHTAPSQLSLTNFKDIPPSLVLFEMDTVVLRHHKRGERVFIGRFPNVGSLATNSDLVFSRQNFFHILSAGHLYDAHDTVSF